MPVTASGLVIPSTDAVTVKVFSDINGGEGGSDITASHDAVENSNDTITWTIEEGYSFPINTVMSCADATPSKVYALF